MNELINEHEHHSATIANQLAREIRRLRLEAGLSQRVLAVRIGYSRQYVSMAEWEDTNLPSRELVAAIDAALAAQGRLVALQRRANRERRSLREQTVDDTPSPEAGGNSTKRRDALRALGIGIATGTGLRDLVLGAAHESSRLSGALNRPPIAAHTIEDTTDDLRRVATTYVLAPDLHGVFVDLVSLRDSIAAQLVFAVRPSDIRELYVLMSAVCALLGSVSHDLAEPNAAFTQTRSATIYAKLAGHRPLETWAHCTRAMIASWWGTPESVLTEADRAGSTHGIPGIRLSGLTARAYAKLGNRNSAQRAIYSALDMREQLPINDDLSYLGSTFSFSPARQHYYNAMTYAELGEWSKVASEANETIVLYSPIQSHTWPTTLTLAQINLARALLHLEGPDAALKVLHPVLTIPYVQRIPQIISGLQRLRADAGRLDASMSRELEEAIQNFKPSRKEAE